MNEKLLVLYLRGRNEMRDLRERVWPSRDGKMLYEPVGRTAEAGLSKIAVTVILVAVAVGLALAVVTILGPAIYNLATQTGEQIEGVPMDWGP